MSTIKGRKTTLVEATIPVNMTNQGRVPFLDQPLLRTQGDQTVVIDAIEFFCVEALGISPISNLVTVPAADIPNAVLVLNVNSFEDFRFIPLASLNRVQTAAGTPFVRDLFELDNVTKIDWTKSYVQYQAAPTTPNTSLLFQVFYRVLKPVKKV